MLFDDMLHNQCEFEDILSHHKDHTLLPDDDAILLAHRVDSVLVKYSLLATWADKEGHTLFNAAPTHTTICGTWDNKRHISLPSR